MRLSTTAAATVLVLLFSLLPAQDLQYSPPQLDGDPVEVVKKLYLDLITFKDKVEFQELQ